MSNGEEREGLVMHCNFVTRDEIWETYFLPKMPKLMVAWSKKKVGSTMIETEINRIKLMDTYILCSLCTEAKSKGVSCVDLDTQLTLLCCTMDNFETFTLGDNFTKEFLKKMMDAARGLGIPFKA
jgi:hypothetical protein